MSRLRCYFLILSIMGACFALPVSATVVRFDVDFGDQPARSFYVELFDTGAPLTVANFLNYMNDGAGNRRYDGTFIHRMISGFVVQGGGFSYDPALGDFSTVSAPPIQTDLPIQNEFDPSRSNIRGTIAMAKAGGDPDSATSQWFINLADNSANLDNQNGGFTVFGRVLGDGMAVVDAIGALNVVNVGSPFAALPVVDVAVPVTETNLITVARVVIDEDRDGVADEIEAAAPNNGDGNLDSIADALQANVASLPATNGQYMTLETDTGLALANVRAVENPSPADTPTISEGSLSFQQGFFSFSVENLARGGQATVTLYLPVGQSANNYFKFGRFPNEFPLFVAQHWYPFLFDPASQTGAKFSAGKVILHFVDGGRGDNDQAANGIIADPGGPALQSIGTGSSGGGGCSMLRSPGQPFGRRAISLDFFMLLAALMLLRTHCSGRTR